MTSINVDPQEISKFEKLAARWWDPSSEFKPLHDINPLRLNYIDKLASLDGKHVLDVGCGGGILSESMARRGATVTGIDLGDKPLHVAQLHAKESELDVEYLKISAEEMAEAQAETYDIVTCMEMLEHVPDPASIVKACAQLVKPGGSVFFSTINRNAKAYLFAILGAEYFLKLLPKGTHNYAQFIRPSELESWTRHAGLHMQELCGMSYNPLSKQYRLGQDLHVNYLAYCQKPS